MSEPYLPATKHAWSVSWINSSRWFWGLLGTVTLWKLFAAWKLGLIFDECYYWEWSLHPQACYFDHPPLTAWLIASARMILGHTTLAVRIWAIVGGIILALAGRELGKDLFGQSAGNRAGILLLLAPIFAGNSLLMTPDTFLIPAWACAVLCAWRGAREGGNLGWWFGAGASAGVGMLSKYTMVLFYGAIAAIWIGARARRRKLPTDTLRCPEATVSTLGLIVSGLTSLLIFLPVLWWNSNHDWVSFNHQLHHGFRNEHQTLINIQNLSDYGAFLIVLVSPILGILCFRTAVTRMKDPGYHFLGVFFWTVVVFFGYSAAKAHIEANWPMAAFVTALIMVAGDWENYGAVWRKAAIIVLLIADIGAFIGVSNLLLPKNSPLSIRNFSPDISFLGKIPGLSALQAPASQGLGDFQTRIEEFLGPESAARTIEENFKASGADFICLSTYQLTGVMSFYAPSLEPLLWLPDHGRVRFPWINNTAWAGKTALLAAWPRLYCYSHELFSELSMPHPVPVPGTRSPLFLSVGKSYNPENARP
jgi:Dolichyl-phosphate-mannose-protein mannosyltransferase